MLRQELQAGAGGPVVVLRLEERERPDGIRDGGAAHSRPPLEHHVDRQVRRELEPVAEPDHCGVARSVDAAAQLVAAPCLGPAPHVGAHADIRHRVVPEAVRPRHEALAGLERHGRREAVAAAEAPEVGSQLLAVEAQVALDLGPELHVAGRPPLGLEVGHGRVARPETATQPTRHQVARDAGVELQVGQDGLHDPDAAVLAAEALQLELLARVLGEQRRGAELEGALHVHLGQSGLERHVGGVREFAVDPHVARAERERAFEQAVARLGQRPEARGVTPLSVGELSGHVERAEPQHPQVAAQQPVGVADLVGVHGGEPEAERIQPHHARELAHVQRCPPRRHEPLLPARGRFERGDDEERIPARVGGGNRLLEQHDPAGVVDLVIHEADQGLRGDGALGVLDVPRLDAEDVGAREDVGGERIGPGDARAAKLQLPQRLRRDAPEAAPRDRAGRDARGEPRHRSPILREAQAAREARRGQVAERGPIEAVLQPGRKPALRGGARLKLARVPEEGVLRLLQRIRAAAEHILPVVQAARVHTERQRRP